MFHVNVQTILPRRILLTLLTVLSAVLGASQCLATDKIIVSGASGKLGGLTVENLLERGVKPADLILVSRTPEELKHYADMGASTRFGDFDKPESLSAAYEGGDRMLLISIYGDDRPARHKRAIDAAIAAGVKQIAYTSFVNMENNDLPLANDHRATEEFLKESGVAWTFLRNSFYMDLVAMVAAEIRKQGSVTVAEPGNGVGYVTREDCAAAAAAVLSTPGHDNKAYDITGPQVIGLRQIAEAVSEITGEKITIHSGEADSVRTFGGSPALAVTSDSVQELTGKSPTNVKDFLRNNRSMWDAQ